MFAMGYASPLRSCWLPDPEQSEYVVAVCSWDDAQSIAGIVAASDSDSDDLHRYRVLRKKTYGPFHVLRGGSTPDVIVDDIAYTIMNPDLPDAQSARAALTAAAELTHNQPRVAIVPYGNDRSLQLYTLVTYDTYVIRDLATFELICNSKLTISLRFRVVTCSFEVGNYPNITALQIAFQAALDAKKIAVRVGSPTPTATVDKQAKFRLTSNSTVRILISTAQSTARMTIGFDLDASMDVNGTSRTKRTHAAVAVGGQSAPMYTGVMQDDDTFRLDTPGIITLTGMRYITLRCPEIEQHVGSIGKYGPYSAGIGVFKLMNPNEVAQLRFDYINLVRKPFHPIARLTRLRLRFELPDNVLYDFKGVNHQILITVKYYTPVPINANAQFPYVLNPDYDPDFMNFVARRTGYADRLDAPGFDPYDEDYTGDDDDSSDP
jgi:hypothetical protein